MKNLKIATYVEFSAEQINYFIETADIEYWINSWESHEDGTATLRVAVEDNEFDPSEEEHYGKSYTLDADSIRKGLELMAKGAPEHFADLVSGEYDCITCDVFIQYACFGDVIYG